MDYSRVLQATLQRRNKWQSQEGQWIHEPGSGVLRRHWKTAFTQTYQKSNICLSVYFKTMNKFWIEKLLNVASHLICRDEKKLWSFPVRVSCVGSCLSCTPAQVVQTHLPGGGAQAIGAHCSTFGGVHQSAKPPTTIPTDRTAVYRINTIHITVPSLT